jgi:hypothetical protein
MLIIGCFYGLLLNIERAFKNVKQAILIHSHRIYLQKKKAFYD